MTTYSQRAPFYNVISSTIHFSAIPTLFIEGITSEWMVNRGAARRDEEPVRPCTIGFGCVRHASRDCEADREWPADHRQVLQVLEAARKARIRVFFTRHMSLPKELMGVSQFRMAMAWQRVKSPNEVKPWFLRDAPGLHLIPEMNPLPSEAIFDKITMSAFEGTPLDMALRDCGIDAFAIVGIAMEIGIEPTVRQGADLGYTPVVVKDACGFGHGDAADRSIASLEFAGDALLTNADTFCALLGRTHSTQAPTPTLS